MPDSIQPTPDSTETLTVNTTENPTNNPDTNNGETASIMPETADSKTVWENDLFRISTRLLGEREIDIDDRNAQVLMILEMKPTAEWDFKIQNLNVALVLKSDDTTRSAENANIGIRLDSMEKLPSTKRLALFEPSDGANLFPGAALYKHLVVQTGAFSKDKPSANIESATPGVKEFEVDLTYDLVPYTAETVSQTNTELVFYVASD